MRNLHGQQVTGEASLRYKMYKAGKLWLFAGISTVGLLLAFGGNPVSADTNTATDTTTTAVKSTTAAPDGAGSQSEVAGTPAETQEVTEQTEKAVEPAATATSSAVKQQDASTPSTTNAPDTTTPQKSAATETSTPTKAWTPPVVVKDDTTNASIKITAEQATIQSGATATFDLNLNVTGIANDGTPQKFIVNLPADFELSADNDLTINGVTPTEDKANHQLIYNFTEPQNGLSVSKQLNFTTESGAIVNGTQLTLSAQWVHGDQTVNVDPATVTVTSKAVYGVTNQFDGVMPSDDQGNLVTDDAGNATIDKTKTSGRAGDLVVYTFGVSAPKQAAGQAYLAEGTAAQVAYLLPKGLTYLGVDSSTPKPDAVKVDANGNTTLVFYFPAPSLAEQEAATSNLISKQFNILARIDADVPFNTVLTTQSIMGATSINGSEQSPIATSKIQTVPDMSKLGVDTNGSIFYFYNWGPKDGVGNLSEDSNSNTDPQVYPNADLSFVIMLGSADFDYPQGPNPTTYFDGTELLTNDGWARTLQKYVATYDVDDHLNVNSLSVGTPYAVLKGNTLALDEAPKFSLFVKYQDSDKYETTPILQDITDTGGQKIDLTGLIDNTRGVDKLQFVWTTPVAGMVYDNIRFRMSPKAGYYGTVGNSLTMNLAGWNALGWVEVQYDENGAYIIKDGISGQSPTGRLGYEVHLLYGTGYVVPEGSRQDQRALYNQFMTTKTAEIVKPAENTPRVINESLGYSSVTAGKIDTGANQLVVRVENNKASLQSFSGLTSYITLPEGVTYTGTDSQVTSEVVDGKTLLTINWDRSQLGPNEANNIALDINVNDTLDLDTVAVGLYSVVDQTDTVVPKSIDPTLDSDVRVLLGVDLPGLNLMRSVYALETVAGVYQPAGHQVWAQAAAQNSAGDKGDLVTVRANEDGQYILSLANTTDNALQNLRLTATLPKLSDRAVLGLDVRGTTTDGVHLTGPIELPASWADKAKIDVRYTTATDQFGVPADKITDFSTVTGFVVTYVDPDGYLDGSLQSIIVPVHVDGDATPGDRAFMSYSLMANNLPVTEGLKAGIEVGARQQASATVTYHDDSTDTDLLVVDAGSDSTLTGFVGSTSAYDTATQIADFVNQGYMLVNDGTKKADGTTAIAFTTDGATTNYVVNLKHTYTATAPHTMTRTIHYVNSAAEKLAPDHVDAASFMTVTDNVTQSATTYVASGRVTAAKVTDGLPDAAWQSGESLTVPEVANPPIANYVVSVTTDASGNLELTPSMEATIKSPNTNVTVTYARAVSQLDKTQDANLIVRYVDKYGKELLPTMNKAGFVGNGFAVTAPDIDGYTLTSDRSASGNFTAVDQTITFVYDYTKGQVGIKQPGTLMVKYVNKYGKELKSTITKEGVAGNGYSVTAPDIDGYTLTTDRTVSGKFTEADQTITFVYDYTQGQVSAEQPANLTVKYVDKYGKDLKQAVTKAGFVGNAFTVTAPDIEGYTLTTDRTASGKFTATDQTITFVYDYTKGYVGIKQPGTLMVKYVDKYGKELKPTITKEGVAGNGYSVTAPDIDGYTLTTNRTVSGAFTTADQTITFVYDYTKGQVGIKQPGTLTIKYVDKYGHELKPTITKEGVAGNGYNVTAPDIDGYTLTTDRTASGTFTTDSQTITFVYDYTKGQVSTFQPAKLTVRYVDKYGKELQPSLSKSGFVGNGYTVTGPDIDGYTLTTDRLVTGKFTAEDQVVTFVYDYTQGQVATEQPAKLTIRYVDKYGNELQPSLTKSGFVGNSYTVTAPDIKGYTLTSDRTASGTLTAEDQTVTFVYDYTQGTVGTQQPATLKVRYVTTSGKAIQPDTIKSGYPGNGYGITPPALSDYTYVGLGKGSAQLTGQFGDAETTVVLTYKKNDVSKPDTDTTVPPVTLPNTGTTEPNHPLLPSTGGDITVSTPTATTVKPNQPGLPATGGTESATSTNQPLLPATGDEHHNGLAVLGLGLLSLVSGAWFRRRED